jgi:hypothetical protein
MWKTIILIFITNVTSPLMLSQEGPKAASGDVDGDGLTDLYICGAAGQAGQLYVQKGGLL